MNIGSDEWINLVQDGAAQLGLTVSQEQAGQFARHGQWLMEWNRKTNLTAITDPVQVAVKHFLDAIAPMNHIPDSGHLLDVGTGGGFPGIPLKIMRPAQPMTLIDSVRKKISFVKHVIRLLALSDIDAHHIRAEIWQQDIKNQMAYPVVTCRALTDLKNAVRLAAPLLSPKGKIILFQGPNQDAGQSEPSSGLHLIDGVTYHRRSYSYTLPVFGDARIITVLERRTDTE